MTPDERAAIKLLVDRHQRGVIAQERAESRKHKPKQRKHPGYCSGCGIDVKSKLDGCAVCRERHYRRQRRERPEIKAREDKHRVEVINPIRRQQRKELACKSDKS